MKIVLASGNQKKLKELSAVLPADWQLADQASMGVAEPEETGLTFIENALIKARNAAATTGLPALADDSGLCVDALDGAPGIYSSRFSGLDATDASNNRLLLEKMTGISDRAAHFFCCIVFLRHAEDPEPLIAHGRWHGSILTAPQGDNGFGYDPLFWLADYQCSSAELTPARKNQISHRGMALQQFQSMLTS